MSIDNNRTAIYVRVSTNKQDVNNQLLQLRAHCEKNKYLIFHEYIDIISGKENSRPGYDQMFNHARRRLFNLVLFWDISRFSRSGTLYTLQKLKELENLGIEWESYQDQYFKSIGPFKDAVISIMATLAKIERERISERTKAGLERARKNGAKIGKRGPDHKPRKTRADWGLKRGVQKKQYKTLLSMRRKREIKNKPL